MAALQLRKCGLHHWKERGKVVTVSDDLYQTYLLQLPFYLGVFGLFPDVLWILSVGYLSTY